MSWARPIAAPLIALCIACSSTSEHAPAGLASPPSAAGSGAINPGSDNAASHTAAGQAGADANGGGASGSGDADEPAAELGGDSGHEIDVVDVPSGPAAPLDLTSQVFMPTTEAFYVFDRAGVVGARRFALDTASLALTTFAADGTALSDPLLDDPLAVAARADKLMVLELGDKGELVEVSYDSKLEQATAPLRLAGAGSGAHALASSADQDLAVWSLDARLQGRLLAGRAAVGDGFDFGPRSCGDHDCVARAIWTGERFAILWTRVTSDGESLLSWGTIDEQGAALAARNVLASQTPLRLEDAVTTSDGRLALLLTLGSPAQAPLLLFVDEFGALTGSAHVYQGATAAWTLASDGTTLLLSARSAQSQGVVRLLDTMGEPQSEWLIVDDSAVASDFEPRVALFAAGQNYGAVVRQTDGASAVLSLDPASFPEP